LLFRYKYKKNSILGDNIVAKDFTADSYRVGSITRALTETVNGQLVLRDADVPQGVILAQLVPDISGISSDITTEVYNWLAQISGQIGMEMVIELSGQVIEYTDLVYTFDQRITDISAGVTHVYATGAFTDAINVFTEPQIIDDPLLINHQDISGVGFSLLSISGNSWTNGGNGRVVCDLSGNPLSNDFPYWGLNIINISGGIPADMTIGTVISAGPIIATVSNVNRASSNVTVFEYIDGLQVVSGGPFTFNYVNRIATFKTTTGQSFYVDGMGRVGISTEELDANFPANGPDIDANAMLTLIGGKTVETKGKAKISIQDVESEIAFCLSRRNEAPKGYIRRTDDVNEKEITIGAEVGGSYTPDFRRDFAIETTYETSKGMYYWPSYDYMAEARHTLDQKIRGVQQDNVFIKETQNLNLVIGGQDLTNYENGSATVHILEPDWIDIYGAGVKDISGTTVAVTSVDSDEQGRFAWQLRPGDLVQYGSDGEIRTVTAVDGHNGFTVDAPFALSGDGSLNWQAKRHLFTLEGQTPKLTHTNNLNDGGTVSPGFFGDTWFDVDALGYVKIQNTDTRLGVVTPQVTIANDSATTGSQVKVAFSMNGAEQHSLVQVSGCFGILSVSGGNAGLHISQSGYVGIGNVSCNDLESLDAALVVSGETLLQNNLYVLENTSIGLDLLVGGSSWISGNADVIGNVSIGGTANITGDTALGADLTVVGDTTLGANVNISGDTIIGLDLTVDGSANIFTDLMVGGNVGVTGNTEMLGTLLVSGGIVGTALTISGDVNISHNLNVYNNAWIAGSLWTSHIYAQTSTILEYDIMNITSNMIYLNSYEPSISGVMERYSGITIDRGPSRDAYGVLFDELDNTFKLGVTTITGTELVGIGNDTFVSYLQPVATRTTITEGFIPFGNDANQYTETANAFYNGIGSLSWNALTAALNVGGTLLVTDGAFISGGLTVTNITVNNIEVNTISVSGAASFLTGVAISGGASIEDGLVVTDGATIGGNTTTDTLIVNGNTGISGDLTVNGNITFGGSLTISDGPNVVTTTGISGSGQVLDSVNAIAAKWFVVIEDTSTNERYATEVAALNTNNVIDYAVYSVLGTITVPVYVELSGSNLVLMADIAEPYKAKSSCIPIMAF
jgi:carbonic anhydrase/acetyltransferase-like protein (isoleucine patch superfamily)